ncbi:Active zone protein ELKS [Trinorchestia longiramus]|nr:Active zone protein ELKS [Trinorchestia longiramus]
MKVDIKIKEAMIDRLKLENAKWKDKVEELEEEIRTLEGELRKVESLEEMEEMIAVVKQKNERVEELEEALRQSVAITSDIETEKNQDRNKMKQITDKLEKLEHKLQRAKDQRSGDGTCPQCPELRRKLKQTTDELAALVAEKKKHMEEIFHMKQDALMSALSEKDAHLALLEESGLRTSRSQQEYKRLTQARAADEGQVKLLADLNSSSHPFLPSDYVPSMEIHRSEKTPSTEGDDDVFTPPKAAPDHTMVDVLSPADRSSSQSSEDSLTMPEDSDHEDTSSYQQKSKFPLETSITNRPLKVGESRFAPHGIKCAEDNDGSLHQRSHESSGEIYSKSGVNLSKQLSSQSSTSDPKRQVPTASCTSEDFASASNVSSSTLYHSLPKDDPKLGCSSTRESIDTLAETDFFSLSEITTADSCSFETETKTEVESLSDTSATEVGTAETSSASEAGSLLEPDHPGDNQDLTNPKFTKNENNEDVDDPKPGNQDSQVKLNTSSNLSRVKTPCLSSIANVRDSEKKALAQAPSEGSCSDTQSSSSSKGLFLSSSEGTDKKYMPRTRTSEESTVSPNEEFLTEL